MGANFTSSLADTTGFFDNRGVQSFLVNIDLDQVFANVHHCMVTKHSIVNAIKSMVGLWTEQSYSCQRKMVQKTWQPDWLSIKIEFVKSGANAHDNVGLGNILV